MISSQLARAGHRLQPNVRNASIKSLSQLRYPQIAQPAGYVRGLASLQASKDPFPVVMMGSGNVMFGTIDGPWNHSLRLERKLAQRLQVAAIIDPNIQRAQDVLSKKLSSSDTAPFYTNTRVCSHITELPPAQPPRLVVIGTHPFSRGMDIPGRDLELQVMRHFPGVPMFVEKPVSTGPVPDARSVAHILAEKGVTCSVGYMLRYLKAVQRMKQIIQDNNLIVMGTNSRYYGAYANGARLDWWDKSREQGPIVEQATHFCDLARYFAGDVDLGTVAARTVEWHERPGKLSRLPIDEDSLIAPENRIPRSTSAIWYV